MSLTFKTYGTRTCSVYGGAGGYGTRISSSWPFYGSSWRPHNANGLSFDISTNGKVMMQNLNVRLALYVPTLHSLECKNAELERKIEEWCASHTVESHDYSEYLAVIKGLHDQIQHICKSSGEIELNIQNASLVAEDFRKKYELELAICKWVETDTACLRKTLDEMTLTCTTLEMEYESLMEELIQLTKNHEEEKAEIHAQAVGQVEVHVDAAPSTDLSENLSKIREDYEAVAAKNQCDLESWYQSKVSNLEKKITEQTEDLECSTKELRHFKSDFHNMQIELESQHSMRMALEDSLQNSAMSYTARLGELQEIITELELKLEQVHANNRSKQEDCENLEAEIKEYKLLLEAKQSDPQVVRKMITVKNIVENSQISGLPYVEVLCKNRYVGRTFIQPNTRLRQLGVAKKFGALTDNFAGKRIVLIDDSIVRGNTISPIIKLLKEAGATEVHIRVASPPIRFPCYMGINIPTKEELIANKPEFKDIANYIGATSVRYLSVEGLVTAVQSGIQSYEKEQDSSSSKASRKMGHCTACLTGKYPIELEW